MLETFVSKVRTTGVGWHSVRNQAFAAYQQGHELIAHLKTCPKGQPVDMQLRFFAFTMDSIMKVKEKTRKEKKRNRIERARVIFFLKKKDKDKVGHNYLAWRLRFW